MAATASGKITTSWIVLGTQFYGARIYKFQVIIVGSIAVFSGTAGAVFVLFSWTAPFYPLITFALCLISMGVGVGAGIFVRREARSRPECVSNDPFGLWP